MEGLVREGHVTRGWIGVEPQDLTPELAASLRLPVKEGVLITGVLQNGPAYEGGLRPGDVVVKIDERPIANQAQLLAAVAALKPQTRATISVLRGERPLDLTVSVVQRPKRPAPVRE
jgi:S1-C subfamily serine protease